MPSRDQILKFLSNNDARYRSKEREALTKKINKTLRREEPRVYWTNYGFMGHLLVAVVVIFALMFQDSTGKNVGNYIAVIFVTLFMAIPILFYNGYKMFETYFKKYPDDFPND